jgi:hypothetical protein
VRFIPRRREDKSVETTGRKRSDDWHIQKYARERKRKVTEQTRLENKDGKSDK